MFFQIKEQNKQLFKKLKKSNLINFLNSISIKHKTEHVSLKDSAIQLLNEILTSDYYFNHSVDVMIRTFSDLFHIQFLEDN